MTAEKRQKLTTRILAHMRAQVAETLAELCGARVMMHRYRRNKPEDGARWLEWRYRVQNHIHQYRVERRMLNLVCKGIVYEARRER